MRAGLRSDARPMLCAALGHGAVAILFAPWAFPKAIPGLWVACLGGAIGAAIIWVIGKR